MAEGGALGGDVLDLEGAAALLKFHSGTMAKLARHYGLGRKVGREWRFTRRQLLAFVERLNICAGEPAPGDFDALLDELSAVAGEPPRPDVTRVVGALCAYLLAHGSHRAAPAVEILAQLVDPHFNTVSPSSKARIPFIPRRRRNYGSE